MLQNESKPSTAPRSSFWTQQDAARTSTRKLVILFLLGLFGLCLMVYLAPALTLGFLEMRAHSHEAAGAAHGAPFHWWHPKLFAIMVGGTTLVVIFASLVRTAQLASGGGVSVALSCGGREVDPASNRPLERRLLNIVEEMSIASGVPMPRVFVLEGEEGINAFAAGWKPESAVVAVTRGALRHLSRDELQGVIAHEFSHILNRDVRINIRLMGLVFGLLSLAFLGRLALEMGLRAMASSSGSRRDSGRDDKDRGGGAMPILLAMVMVGGILIIAGLLGQIFARMIQAAISRQREFLADASAVQFTRNPDGLGNALKRIGGVAEGSRMQTAAATEASHMFFSSVGASLFATHPPITERIRRLDPAWDGRWPTPRPDSGDYESTAAQHRPGAVSPMAAGLVSADDLREARTAIDGLPQSLYTLTREPFGARALACVLLLDKQDETVRDRQLQLLAADPALAMTVRRAMSAAVSLDPDSHLPLLALATPALRQLTPTQRNELLGHIDRLIAIDDHMNLEEWCLRRCVMAWTEPDGGAMATRHTTLQPVQAEVSCLLSTLARTGQPDDPQSAFLSAVGSLGMPGLPMHNPGKLPSIDQSLDALRQTDLGTRRRLVEACRVAIHHDGEITLAESALLHAIAATLSVTLPTSAFRP